MNPDVKNQQIEFDVFPKDHKSGYAYLGNIKTETHQEASSVNVVFSHQSVIIIFICAVMLLIASFTLGVEKGKLIAKDTLTMEKISSDRAAAVPPLSAATTTKVLNVLPETQKPNGLAIVKEEPSSTPLVPASMVAQPKEHLLPQSGYTIQIATVKTDQAAKKMAEILTKKGWTSFTKPSGKYIVVLAGNYSRKEDAQIKLKELKKTYSDCFIKKI
jgi:cell division septation protein DedD